MKSSQVLPKAIQHSHITGDFNLDLLKHESHSVTAQFTESSCQRLKNSQELQHIKGHL